MRTASSHQGRCASCGNATIVDYLLAPDRFHGRRTPFRLVYCPKCTLVWMPNPPKADEMAVHYSREYDRSIALAGVDSPGRWRERKKTLFEYKRSGAILDLGCSNGSFLKSLDSNEWELNGIEMSSESARRAREESGARIFVGEILDAPFQSNCFDAITCFHVFEHLDRPQEVMQKVFEWLRPGGVFYALVPNIDSAGAHIFRSYWYALELPRHIFHYSPTSLRMMARSVGLEVVSLTTHREVFIEQSCRYILDDILRGIRIQRKALANARPPHLIFRVVRKAFRLTLLPILTSLASFAGDGESIHAVFQKNPSPNQKEAAAVGSRQL